MESKLHVFTKLILKFSLSPDYEGRLQSCQPTVALSLMETRHFFSFGHALQHWDLISPTRNGTHSILLHSAAVLTTGPSGSPQKPQIFSQHISIAALEISFRLITNLR